MKVIRDTPNSCRVRQGRAAVRVLECADWPVALHVASDSMVVDRKSDRQGIIVPASDVVVLEWRAAGLDRLAVGASDVRFMAGERQRVHLTARASWGPGAKTSESLFPTNRAVRMFDAHDTIR